MSSNQLNSTIALVGSPNSGKTTLFNWLTGSSFKTVNYAGSTVDCHAGQSLDVYGDRLHILDTPGIYSLQPHGRDEEVTLKALTERSDVRSVVVVIDGTQLNRQLYLVRQIQELGIPMVVALTMMDLVKQAGRRINLEKLSELTGAPVVPIDGRLGGGVKELLNAARALESRPVANDARRAGLLDWDERRIEKEIATAERWTREVLVRAPELESLDRLRRLDAVFLHPVFGVIAFLVIMASLFSSIFWLASPLMDLVDAGFAWLAESVLQWSGGGLIGDFFANGLVAGVGSVLVFVPQIFILSLGLSLLEDTGYLARAATIVDKPLHKLGLSGRSFVPLLSGFACAVPAVMAARNIRSARERWITVFIIPLMTCSARLPVYALLLTFLFFGDSAWQAGLAMTALYVGGLLVGALAAIVLNKLVKVEAESHFLMELPFYRLPKFWFTVMTAARRTKSYIVRAGPTIFVFVVALWIGTHVPYQPDAPPAQQLSESVVGRVGQMIEPVFEPMGIDWRAGLGIISAFVAREVFVSSLAVIFNIAETDSEETLREGLISQMRSATFADGTPIFTKPTVVGLLIFFMIALQCLSTTGVSWRETGSWRFAMGQLVALNVVAYVLAVAVVQIIG